MVSYFVSGQIRGLELEHKKLEEDIALYNKMQEHLKQSPAYSKMLEYGRAHFNASAETGKFTEKPLVIEDEEEEMSFEELLALEKKDGFW